MLTALHCFLLFDRVGVQAMRIPILDTTNDQSQCSDNRNRATRSPVHRLEHRSERNRENAEGIFESSPPQLNLNYSATWSVMGDIETRQYDLASALLESAKGSISLHWMAKFYMCKLCKNM